CQMGNCAPACNAGFDDCNSGANDGCESDLTSITTCGACGYLCSLNGTTGQACVSGHCAPTCGLRYADCNSDSVDRLHDDGCEVYLDALDACTVADGCNGPHVACDPLQVCNAGACVAAQGLAVLSVPLTDATQKHRFADLFVPAPNLEGSLVTIRAYAPGATGGSLVVYLSDTSSNSSAAVVTTDLTSISGKWTDINVPIATLNAFNATSVKQVNLEVWAGTGPWLNPTRIYVDSIRTSNLVVSDTFDSSIGNLVQSSLLVVPGSTLTWADTLP
ncbi:MAG TPA: hypothetical protein VGJ91_01975, partial [Polyangiaceae bacterium]